ncbi:MAG TPA: glycosyltransferase [Thermoanaerobaculia bacterium]|nr:glycosyltransferase [Thermoanaerobaculia bacterium]
MENTTTGDRSEDPRRSSRHDRRVSTGAPRRRERAYRKVYLSVTGKFIVASAGSVAWFAISLWLGLPWMRELAHLTNWVLSVIIIGGIALVPGAMNAFLAVALIVDNRPPRKEPGGYPGVSILIAAYNEGDLIANTLRSIEAQDYPGEFEAIVIDDCSTDCTVSVVEERRHPWARVIRQETNQGKAAALNRALREAKYDIVVTIDGDSYLYYDALRNIVERYLSDPPSTRAVAGTVLVGNSRKTWITRAQEWDYFNGIAAIKRMQSLFHGTLVAQGAFSLYEKRALLAMGGWSDCVGEDIVLTWGMLEHNWRIGHAEDACCFTQAPERLSMFIHQRRRWARGMLEAFRRHPHILRVWRMSTFFILWNLLFPWLDLTYTFAFIPGIVLAMFGKFWIVGPMTLALIPVSLLINALMYRVGRRMFGDENLRVRRNISGFLTYVFAYALILQPASVAGYISEILNLRKSWGTK